MNPLNEHEVSRLQKSVEWSRRQLKRPRQNRIDAIKQYVGYHYNDGGAQKRIPVNMLALAVIVYVRQLAAQSPQVLITTKNPDMRPTAANLELAINQIPREINLDDTLRRLVTEALFSIGIAKCGLHGVGSALGHSYGESFVDIVTLDDYFLDMSVNHIDKIDYEGNDFWLDYDEVMESDWVNKKVRGDLKPDEHSDISPEGDERAEDMSTSETAEKFRKKLWLRDVWLPSESLLVTFGVKSKQVLNTVDWDGPERGPYHKLGFNDVPGNLLPLSPVSLWRDLHELSNKLFRKLGNQAESQKTVLGFPGGNDDAVRDFKKSSDGDGINYSGGEPKTLEAGGVDPKTLAFYLQCRDLYSYFAGNLDSLGGLAPMTQTVGQDKLLSEAAGAQLRDMSSKTVGVVRDIFRSLAHYEWYDPIKRRELEKPIPGTDLKIPVAWDQRSKRGSFDMYDLDINVHSLQDDSPSMKLQKLTAIVQQHIIPLMPLIEKAGGILDVQAFLRLVAKLSNMPEIAEIVTFMDQSDGAGGAEKAGMPSNTTREYVRTGRPGMTKQGASAALQQQLMSGGTQDSGEVATGG